MNSTALVNRHCRGVTRLVLITKYILPTESVNICQQFGWNVIYSLVANVNWIRFTLKHCMFAAIQSFSVYGKQHRLWTERKRMRTAQNGWINTQPYTDHLHAYLHTGIQATDTRQGTCETYDATVRVGRPSPSKSVTEERTKYKLWCWLFMLTTSQLPTGPIQFLTLHEIGLVCVGFIWFRWIWKPIKLFVA